jgi:YggT family protein
VQRVFLFGRSVLVLQSIFILIVDVIASILVGVLLLRFWMQAVRVRPPMSIGQFVFQLTDWLVKPLRRLLPGVGGYDWASLAGAFLILTASIAVVLLLAGALAPDTLLLVSLLRLIKWIIYGFTALIIIEVIFSWVNPHAPLAPFVRALNEPFLRPLRRIVPALGGLDLSPMVALLMFQIILQILLPRLALQMGGPLFMALS